MLACCVHAFEEMGLGANLVVRDGVDGRAKCWAKRRSEGEVSFYAFVPGISCRGKIVRPPFAALLQFEKVLGSCFWTGLKRGVFESFLGDIYRRSKLGASERVTEGHGKEQMGWESKIN
jgi:hypothetical protein